MLGFKDFAFSIIFTFIIQVSILYASEIKRPRGVSISRKSLYPEQDTFTCIDGKKIIKYSQINDDFCDCADASDEPGTSACSNGIFHCTNAGHRSIYIPSSRVNDQICDCCDGSDEYDSNVNCANNCLELGREERKKERTRQELLKKGAQFRAELSAKGKSMKLERDNRLAELENRKSEAEAILQEKENLKKDAETLENEALEMYREIQETEKREKQEKEAAENRKEAEETFIKFDSNGDNQIEIIEIQTRISFDKDRNGEVSIEEARFFLDEKDIVDKETFMNVCWNRIKPYLMLDSGLFMPPRDVDDENNARGESHDTQTPEGDEDHQEEAELLDPEIDDHDNHHDHEDEEEDNTGEGEVEEQTQKEYDPETQALIEKANAARNEFSEADRVAREINTEIKDLNDAIAKDYGIDEEFAPLDGECFNYEDREYVYKLCPFDRTSQQARSGGSETRLGSWDRWVGRDYKYSHMLYNNGASCWNGPQRSALVTVECGIENRVVSVSEPNRCEYHMTFETPAACFIDDASAENDETVHDEL